MPRLPEVTWTIDHEPVDISDWSANCVLGGFGTMQGVATEKVARSLKSSVGQGSVITGYTPSGVMWEGRLTTPPHVVEGRATIYADGHQARMDVENERLLFQSRDYSLWQGSSDAPFNFSGFDEFDAEARESTLFFKVNKESYTLADSLGLAMWAPGAKARRYAFTIVKSRDSTSFDLRVNKFTGPSGTITLVTDHGLAAASPTVISNTLANPQDGLEIKIRCNTTNTNGQNAMVRINNLRVNDISSDDTFSIKAVLDELADRCGYEARIGSGLSLNTLPLDWVDNWASLADYVVTLGDGWYRVLEDCGNGPCLEADSWKNSDVWTVSQSQGARLDLSPLELFNQVQVNYEGLNGAPLRVRVSASPNPLSGLGYDNVYEESLEDRQPDEDLATSVADYLLGRYSIPRWSGTIELHEARSPFGNDPFKVRPGDKITVTDWDMAQSFTHRVVEAEYQRDLVTVSVEQDVSAARLIANSDLRRARKRKRRR